jgi:hypothetical protein
VSRYDLPLPEKEGIFCYSTIETLQENKVNEKTAHLCINTTAMLCSDVSFSRQNFYELKRLFFRI